MKDKIKQIPLLGNLSVWLNHVVNSRSRHAELAESTEHQNKELDSIKNSVATLIEKNEKLSELVGQQQKLFSNQIALLNSRYNEQDHAVTIVKSKNNNQNSEKDSGLFADNHALDAFYLAFENRFRGSEKEISARLSIYEPVFKKLGTGLHKKPVLDIGCGRGEFLKFVKDLGLKPLGVDLNENMIKEVKSRGFEATQENAIDFLIKEKPSSYSAITGFHLVEHIPFNDLLTLFSECCRVLAPGGFILFETPNPENVIVGSCNFYMDPSHLNPIPPHLLQFTAEYQGFSPVTVMRIREREIAVDGMNAGLVDIAKRFGAAPDYSIIGYKPVANG